MITKEQAVNPANTEFCSHNYLTGKPMHWRRSGQTQVWVTRPDDFRIPVMYGLYHYSNITAITAEFYHLLSECPNK